MKLNYKLLLTAIGFAIVMQLNTVAYAYDGRGSESCPKLKEAISNAKQEMREARSSLKSKKSSCLSAEKDYQRMEQDASDISGSDSSAGVALMGVALVIQRSATTSICDSANKYEDKFQQANYGLSDAIDDYNMNGCTSGGSTRYNHNYSN